MSDWGIVALKKKKKKRRRRRRGRIHCMFADLMAYFRRRVSRLPVVKNPLSPIAPRHSMDNWPRIARPSRFMSFCNVSTPSGWPSFCSTRNATCRTSRGYSVGSCDSVPSGLSRSQFSEIAWKGGLGFIFVCYLFEIGRSVRSCRYPTGDPNGSNGLTCTTTGPSPTFSS